MKKVKKKNLPNSITEIFITGGPSGGKTTGIKKLVKWLTRQGFRVLVSQEKATDMINGGVQDINEVAKKNPKLYEHIEEQMLLWQLDDRKRLLALARGFSNQAVVIIYDRGPMDVRSYVSAKVFNRILRRNHLSLAYLRNQGQGVIHLVSAAIGAKKFYNTKNNKARRESVSEAKKVDQRTLHAWLGHPHLMIINNGRSKSFKHKMERLLQAVCRLIGIPVMIEIERKFLIEKKPDFNHSLLKNAPCTEIEQMYLEENINGRWRIRKSIHDDHVSYCTLNYEMNL